MDSESIQTRPRGSTGPWFPREDSAVIYVPTGEDNHTITYEARAPHGKTTYNIVRLPKAMIEIRSDERNLG